MLIAHHDPSWIIVGVMLGAVGITLISVMFNLHGKKGDIK